MVRASSIRCVAILALSCCACQTFGKVRISHGSATPITARALVIVPVAHRFVATAQDAFLRALPICARALRRGGLLVIGPDEAPLGRKSLHAEALDRIDTIASLANRFGAEPSELLIWRTFVEERVAQTARALFDTRGKPRGGVRDVDVVLLVRMAVVPLSGGAPILEGAASAPEDPFAETPEHDRRPTIRRLISTLANAMIEALARRLQKAPHAVPALDGELLAHPTAFESFRLGTEPSLAEVLAREPLLGEEIRRRHWRALAAPPLEDAEIARWRASPRGVWIRRGFGPFAAGDVALDVNSEPTATPWALQRALFGRASSAAKVRARIWRNGRELFVDVP
jgi:hypothetical protein